MWTEQGFEPSIKIKRSKKIEKRVWKGWKTGGNVAIKNGGRVGFKGGNVKEEQ